MNPRSINYAIELEKFLSRLGDRKPRLLLHSCCAPCSSVCLERLTQYFDITLFYYNPNLFPAEEYARRVAEQRRLIAALPHANAMDFVEGSYDPDLFYQVAAKSALSCAFVRRLARQRAFMPIISPQR